MKTDCKDKESQGLDQVRWCKALASPWISVNHSQDAARPQHTVCLLQELARGHRWQLVQQIRACHEVEAAVLHRQRLCPGMDVGHPCCR